MGKTVNIPSQLPFSILFLTLILLQVYSQLPGSIAFNPSSTLSTAPMTTVLILNIPSQLPFSILFLTLILLQVYSQLPGSIAFNPSSTLSTAPMTTVLILYIYTQ